MITGARSSVDTPYRSAGEDDVATDDEMIRSSLSPARARAARTMPAVGLGTASTTDVSSEVSPAEILGICHYYDAQAMPHSRDSFI